MKRGVEVRSAFHSTATYLGEGGREEGTGASEEEYRGDDWRDFVVGEVFSVLPGWPPQNKT